jgi:hypothetical protein
LLEEEFCSPWWIAASHVRRHDGQGRILVCRKRDAYPVAGMVQCSACGRWAPADPLDPLCIDCRTETEHERFLRRVRRWPPGDRADLFRTYWRRPMGMCDWFKEGMPPLVGVIDFDVVPPDGASDNDSPIRKADLYDGSLEPDQRWGDTSSFHESLRRMRDCFAEEYVTRKGEIKLRLRRRFGHQKALLPESDNALRKEIAYFRKTGRIMPRARRLNNPFDKSETPMKAPGRAFDPEENFFNRT